MRGTREPSRSSDDGVSPCGGYPRTCRRLRVRVRRLPGPVALILGDPEAGLAFEAPGPVLGTFLAPAAGLCGMLPWPRCPGIPEEESLARPGQRQAGARRTSPRKQRRVRHHGDVVSVLARNAREVEAAAQRGPVPPAVRTKFQAISLLLRDERARVRATAGSDGHRADQLRRPDGIATIPAATPVRAAPLLALLAEDSDVSDAARPLK